MTAQGNMSLVFSRAALLPVMHVLVDILSIVNTIARFSN
jgi:hypothetical protein